MDSLADKKGAMATMGDSAFERDNRKAFFQYGIPLFVFQLTGGLGKQGKAPL